MGNKEFRKGVKCPKCENPSAWVDAPSRLCFAHLQEYESNRKINRKRREFRTG